MRSKRRSSPDSRKTDGKGWSTLLRNALSDGQLLELYTEYYRDKPFVRVRSAMPATKDTTGTNFLDVAVRSVRGRVLVLAREDNLVRGASGVAVQNLNRMLGIDERVGLL